MSYNIVLTTAEDIVAVVDAIVAKGEGVTKNFVSKCQWNCSWWKKMVKHQNIK